VSLFYDPLLLASQGSTTALYPEPENIFIGKYLEGTSYNKAIEIYNPASFDSSLSNCIIRQTFFTDSVTTSTKTTTTSYLDISLEDQVIKAHSGFTVSHTSLTIESIKTQTSLFNGNLKFNGDDMISLICSDVLFDVIGSQDSRFNLNTKGLGWTIDGVTDATIDHYIIRESNISVGNYGVWNGQQEAVTSTSQWTVLPLSAVDTQPWGEQTSTKDENTSSTTDSTTSNSDESEGTTSSSSNPKSKNVRKRNISILVTIVAVLAGIVLVVVLTFNKQLPSLISEKWEAVCALTRRPEKIERHDQDNDRVFGDQETENLIMSDL